jgi:hypothetical protein
VDETGPIETTLGALVGKLTEAGIPYMVVGGLAVLIHGVARFTRDIDVMISHPREDVAGLLDSLGSEFRPRVDDPTDFVRETRLLPLAGRLGTPVDLVFAAAKFDEEAIGRARPEELGTVTAQVCTPEDLIVMKIVSERPLDREDVAGVVRHSKALDFSRLDPMLSDLARDLDRPDILEFWEGLYKGP